MQKPPPQNLICLDTIPSETWAGRTVYYPLAQSGSTPYWREADIPPNDPLRDADCENPEEYIYDVGVVQGWEPDPLMERPEVYYRTKEGSFHSGSSYLWVEWEPIPRM